MDLLIFFIVFITGLSIGSFLNVVIFRLETEDKIVNSRSKCLACGHQLASKDLVPLLSFIFLRAKCRYCNSKISWQYPLVEFSTAILLSILFLQYVSSGGINLLGFMSFFFLVFVFFALVVIFVFDLKYYIIPDQVVYSAIASAFIWNLTSGYLSADFGVFYDNLFAAFLAGGFFFSIVLITKGKGMGGGDIKLGFLMGLILGVQNVILAVFIAFLSGALFGIVMMVLGKKGMKSMLPFGPFLIFGLLASYFYAEEIFDWYWGLFLF